MPKEYSRTLRINSQIQRELTALIREGLSDPRVAGVTVTEADVSPDLRQARITVSVLGTDEELKLAVQGLNHAAGKLRYGLGKRLKLRLTPNLRFVPDVALREGDRISSMLRKALEQDQIHAKQRED